MEITDDLQRQIDEYKKNVRAPISKELQEYLDELDRKETRKRKEIKQSLVEHDRTLAKVAYTIHELIAENHLSIQDAKMILNEAIKRIDRYSQVTPIEYDFEDIRNLVQSRYIRPVRFVTDQQEDEIRALYYQGARCSFLPSSGLCQGIAAGVCSQR